MRDDIWVTASSNYTVSTFRLNDVLALFSVHDVLALITYKLQSDITLEVNDYWPKEQRMPIILAAIA
jgi:hypothetical protein